MIEGDGVTARAEASGGKNFEKYSQSRQSHKPGAGGAIRTF